MDELENMLMAGFAEYRERAATAQAEGLCVGCGEPALPKCYSEAGVREYRISGQCEPCFDAMFADPDDEEV